jgi:hypothetical protein
LSRPLSDARPHLSLCKSLMMAADRDKGENMSSCAHLSARALPEPPLETFCSVCWERSIGTYPRSLELRGGVVVPLECSVDNLGAHVDHVGHNGLALRTVPRNISGLSVSVSVGGSVVLVEDRGLSGSPLSVSIRARRVPG